MFELFKRFSANYATGVSALVGVAIVFIAVGTFWYLTREFAQKYRPYVVAQVVTAPRTGSKTFDIFIVPRNVGEHPCEFMLTNIRLHIGDETYDTPNIDWMLLAPRGVEISVPAGHVNEIGITRVREARYKSNRIESEFDLHTRSIEKKFEEAKTIKYEINVLTEVPVVVTRPGWQKSIEK